MNISRNDVDALNSIITIIVNRSDYFSKVQETLKDYRKKANIPGFRKGHVPMGLVKKQYENRVIIDEVNKLLKENIENYIVNEKIDILGGPIALNNKNIDWSSEKLEFKFEIGLSPSFEIKFNSRKKITSFKIEADNKMVNDQVNNLRKQYGKIVSKDEIKNGYEIVAKFSSIENQIDNTSTFSVDDIKGKKNKQAFLGLKPGKKLQIEANDLFVDIERTQRILGINNEVAKDIKGLISVEINEVNQRVLAQINQDLFDKLYKKENVKSEKELREIISRGIEKQLEQQSDQKLLNDITEYLVKNIKFDLPEDFLKKWIKNSSSNSLSDEKVIDEYSRSEKGIRYQLIESKIISENNLKINNEELKNFAKEMIMTQINHYGQNNTFGNQEMDNMVSRVLSNNEESKRLQEQLMNKKLLGYYKKNAPLNIKKVNFESFIAEAYGKA